MRPETAKSRPVSPPTTPPPAPGPVDVYRDWLGVENVERPPSPYALLGLMELEDDPQAIAEGARRVKKVVRGYQIGRYRKEALTLLTEIGQAVELLNNKEKKSEYDHGRFRRYMELAKANFPQADLQRPLDDLFVQWLADCEKGRLPVARLLPHLMDWCLERPFAWPLRGPHNVPLPLALWIYFEAAVVGQCVERSPLAQRIRAVKALQQAFGINEQLARFLALDVARRPQSFAGTELVHRAAAAPRDEMQNWLDRLIVRGVVLDQESQTYQALAFLLGLADESGKPIAEPVKPRIVHAQKVPLDMLVMDYVRDAWDYVRRFMAEYPGFFLALKLALQISLVIAVLIMALLIVISLLSI